MWTPKRLLLLVIGFAAFFGVYQVYVYFLGRYDGLPPLPDEHRRGRAARPVGEHVRPPENPAIALLRKYFPGGDEAERDMRFYWQPQGIVMAADDGKLVDGKLMLTKVSVALLGKPRDSGEREVNTLRGQTAHIEFDQPISNLKDANDRRPVGGTIEGNVRLQNNRRTARMDDDLHLDTEWLAFNEDQHRVWTDRPVVLTDSHPFQRRITGTGLEVILLPKEEKPGDRKEKHKPSVGGVKQIRLEREVRMDLLVDADGFMSSGAASARPAAKSPVAVTSRGPFLYEVECEPETDRATFTDHVNVIRKLETPAAPGSDQPGEQYDQLDCEKLVLLFRRKGSEEKARPAADEGRMDLTLLSARATGKQVVLVSDAEHLNATGNDFLYDATTKRSILKGEPDMVAERDGHQMRARALVLEGVGDKDPKRKGVREAVALGPGEIRMKMPDRPDQPGLVARWQDELRSAKEGNVDRLTLTGQVFLEDAQRGRLQADRLTVWLQAVEAKENGETKRRSQPQRMEAHGNVRTFSPELRILHADTLHMQFQDALPVAGERSAIAPSQVTQSPQTFDMPAKPAARPDTLPPADARKPRQPIELRARKVEAKVLRDGNRNELKELHTEGEVQVVQRPQKPDDQTVEIKGDRLDLHSYPAGHVLQVSGRPAFVQLDKLFITGPVVNINQPDNNAWVTGTGSLKMPSRSNFEGQKLERPTDLIVHWKEGMAFDGRMAQFDGGVQASQDAGRLTCRMLQVVLDQPVSLREQDRKGQQSPSPSIHRLLCVEDVRFEDGILEGDKWRVFRRVEGNELSFNNPEGELGVSGPGAVYLLQPGSKEGGLLESASPASGRLDLRSRPGEEQEMKLTRIIFEGTMVGNKNSGIVTFNDRVEVLHLPADDPDVLVNPNRLPPRAMWLRCRKLKVLMHKLDGNRNTHEFHATGQVRVDLEEFEALADSVKYDESKELLILEGDGPNKVTILRKSQRGAAPQPYRGKKFFYNRKTGQLNGDKVDLIRPNP